MSPASDGCFQRAWEAGSGGLSAGLLVAGAVAQSLGGQRWLAELDNRRYRSRGKKLRHSLRNVPRAPIPSSRCAWGARRAGTPVVTVAQVSRVLRQRAGRLIAPPPMKDDNVLGRRTEAGGAWCG